MKAAARRSVYGEQEPPQEASTCRGLPALSNNEKLAPERPTGWDRLTLKQKRFIKAYFETGGNASAAARRAGYAKGTERVAGARNIAKDNILGVIREILDQADLTEEVIARKIAEGTNATEIKFFVHGRRIIDQCEVIDWAVRLDYIQLALKLKGYL